MNVQNESSFKGFPGGKLRFTPIPAPFFTELLAQIDDLVELKLSLYAFWYLNQQEGSVRFITREQFTGDPIFMSGLGPEPIAALDDGLQKALKRGIFLEAKRNPESSPVFFLNSPRGRAAVELVKQGKWTPGSSVPASLDMERPNIFRLYEEHIGPLTPIMSDTLKEAEETYPAAWIEDAIRLAVHKNARSWRYIDAILRSWQEKGRHETNRRNAQEDYRGYIEGDFAEFIEH
jgi:DNA replication protein